MEAYQTLFAGSGVLGTDFGIDIDRDDYPLGYFLTVFDLDRTANHNSLWSRKQSGNLRIEVRFGTALKETVSMLIYAEFPDIIEIDESRNIILS